LASPLATGDALLHRGRHGARERRLVVPQRIIPGGQGGLHAGLQIPQPTQRTDDASADLLDDRSNVSIGGGLTLNKTWPQSLSSAVHIDALHEDAMEMEVHIDRTAKTLDKRDRSRVDGGPLETACDRLVDIILTDGGANDGMDLGREVLGPRHPVAQRDRHREDPLARRYPGDDALDQMRRHLRHASSGTRGAKPASLATEGHQHLVLAGVTAETEKPVRQDATPQ